MKEVAVESSPVATRRLSESAFLGTHDDPMSDVTSTAVEVLDIWPYATSVPPQDLEGHDATCAIAGRLVERVYRTGSGYFDHVLIPTKSRDVFLVVVVDRHLGVVYGHHLLNLRRLFGIEEAVDSSSPLSRSAERRLRFLLGLRSFAVLLIGIAVLIGIALLWSWHRGLL